MHQETGESIAENFLSGAGIVNIYSVICKINNKNTLYKTPEEIAINYNHDNLCKETIENFIVLWVYLQQVF